MSKFGLATSNSPSSSILQIVYILLGRGGCFPDVVIIQFQSWYSGCVKEDSHGVTDNPHPAVILHLLGDFIMFKSRKKKVPSMAI